MESRDPEPASTAPHSDSEMHVDSRRRPVDSQYPETTQNDAGNESEAETEILNRSKSNTPRKPLGKQQTSKEMSTIAEMDSDGDTTNGQEQPARSGVKRKARPSELNQTRRSFQRGSRSPTKKTRMSPEYEVTPRSSSSESEYEPDLDIKSSITRSSRRRSGASEDHKQHRETHIRETRGSRQIPSESAPPSAVPSSYRASSHEVRPRSTSPHSLHKRSSSFQSPLTSTDPHHSARTSRRSYPPGEHVSAAYPSSSITNESERRTRSTLHQSQSLDPDIPNSLMAPRKEVDRVGRTPLAQACYACKSDVAIEILERNPEMIEIPDHGGTRPLHFAASYSLKDVVQRLLDMGCELDCRNQASETPLFNAIESNEVEIAQLLLEKGANPWLKDHEYGMPRDLLPKDPEDDAKELERALMHAATLRLDENMPDSREQHLPVSAAPVKDQMNVDLGSMKTMAQACLVGNEGLLNDMLNVRTRPIFSCALAAAKGGHQGVLRKVLESSYRKSNNKTAEQEHLEMMKTALGRGNLEVVQYLLSRDALSAEAKIDGQTFVDVARARKGPLMKREIKILKIAYNDSRRRAGGTEEELYEVESEEDTNSEPQDLESIQHDDDVMDVDDDDVVVQQPNGFKDGEEEEIVNEVQEQQPPKGPDPPFTLRWAMTPPHYPNGQEMSQFEPSDRRWRMAMSFLPKCHVLKRSEIEGPSLSGPPNEEYTLNIYAPMYLRHTTLTQCRDQSGMSTLPITEAMRQYFLKTTLPLSLVEDNHWAQAREPTLTNQCPHAYEMQITGRPSVCIDPRPGREWIQHATADQLFWVSWEAFCKEWKGCAWLAGCAPRREVLATFQGVRPWEAVYVKNQGAVQG